MKRMIIATASVLALSIGGAGVSFAANIGTANPNPDTGSNMPTMSATSQPAQTVDNLSGAWASSKQELQQAQQQLRDQGLYHGKIDGVLGPETKQALRQFQQKNGLSVTAMLDQPTMDKLLGTPAVGQGSSMPPSNLGRPTGATGNPNAVVPPSNLGDQGAAKH